MTNFKTFLLMYILLNINNTFSEILSSFPEPTQQAEFSFYEIRKSDETESINETGFFVAPDLFVTSFQSIGYPYGVLTKLQKTGSLLGEEAGYCFIHQASFEHSDGASGSPVLNTKGEAVGVVYTEIAPHTNSSCATDSDKIGTNCNTFSNATDCIEQGLNSMRVSLCNGTDTSRYIGMYRADAYRQIQFTNHFETLQTIDVKLEQQEDTLRKLMETQ